MTARPKPYRGTQAVLRAFRILQTFDDDVPEWSLTELADELDLNRTTTYRLLTALESLGMVARDEETQAYRLGPEAIVIGGRALRANFVRKISRAELKRLSSITGETATLDILDGNHTLILDEVKGKFVVGMTSAIGTRWPAHASSTGKVLLASLLDEEINERLPRPLLQLTPHTVTQMAHLQQQLVDVREQGFAVASDELEIGYTDIAAPIYNHDREVCAALTVGGATTRIVGEKQEAIVQLLREATEQVSRQIGYRERAEE